jgi:hypothetical protein
MLNYLDVHLPVMYPIYVQGTTHFVQASANTADGSEISARISSFRDENRKHTIFVPFMVISQCST